jgi:hypothetical protein
LGALPGQDGRFSVPASQVIRIENCQLFQKEDYTFVEDRTLDVQYRSLEGSFKQKINSHCKI